MEITIYTSRMMKRLRKKNIAEETIFLFLVYFPEKWRKTWQNWQSNSLFWAFINKTNARSALSGLSRYLIHIRLWKINIRFKCQLLIWRRFNFNHIWIVQHRISELRDVCQLRSDDSFFYRFHPRPRKTSASCCSHLTSSRRRWTATDPFRMPA